MDLLVNSPNMFYKLLIFFIILLILILQLILIFNSVTVKVELISKNEKLPLDYELKDIDKCYLNVHNFVTLKSKNWNYSQNDIEFKSYIYGYTKPYLLELVQNSTHDCLCCT